MCVIRCYIHLFELMVRNLYQMSCVWSNVIIHLLKDWWSSTFVPDVMCVIRCYTSPIWTNGHSCTKCHVWSDVIQYFTYLKDWWSDICTRCHVWSDVTLHLFERLMVRHLDQIMRWHAKLCLHVYIILSLWLRNSKIPLTFRWNPKFHRPTCILKSPDREHFSNFPDCGNPVFGMITASIELSMTW